MSGGSGNLYIGTSGWHYPHWREILYPAGMGTDQWLAHYAGRFASVEVNSTFYRFPDPGAVATWADRTPATFRFSVKAPRGITHFKKLKNCSQPLAEFFAHLAPLGERLGPVLFQLPPRWRCNPARLAAFLEDLPVEFRYAFEFRDPSWETEQIWDLLERFGVAFCICDLGGRSSPRVTTTEYVYIRLHGPGQPYADNYSPTILQGWVSAIRGWLRNGKDVYCYFDNDASGYAVKNASQLQRLLTL